MTNYYDFSIKGGNMESQFVRGFKVATLELIISSGAGILVGIMITLIIFAVRAGLK
ncbi:MAG: hypothetical protein PHO02_00160 [Candidatus Nanoarchaeia archaeon]|nr:hypothetical protein [Candidatus Nanoarchaeia archaeon]